MNKTCKKRIALLLVLLQLVVLLPFTAVDTQAAGNQPADTGAAVMETKTEAPRLNPVIRGTVQFGTFNFTSSSTNYDGADYVMPFVYTDDYFAAPSYSAWPGAKTVNWTALEDKSLATASLDFTMACFGSNEEITDVTDYDSDYDKNGREFLAACDFGNIAVNDYVYDGTNALTQENKYNTFPSKDSIGAVMGSKTIKVWNGTTNEEYTLVAIGVRGAGYGAEWASNLTLGTSGEHQGFREAANKVEYMLDDYMSTYGITASDHVKFWVVGYSRSGAVANLVAGDLSGDKYNVAKTNVYGYTFESAAGADKTVDPNGTVYPNIHNILNKQDAVPRVSMEAFGNNRYGVDYLVPYYGNANATLNETYYNRMYNILKTVATGYLDDNGNFVEDGVISSAHPDNYPVNGTIMVHKFVIVTTGDHAQAYTDQWNGETNYLGTRSGSNYYLQLDTFLDKLVNGIFGSRAWDYNFSQGKVVTATDAAQHRVNYNTLQPNQPETFQEAMRSLVGVALGTPGAKLTDLLDNLTGDLLGNIGGALSLYRSIAGFLFSKGYDGNPTEAQAETVTDNMNDFLKKMLREKEPFSSNRAETETAIDTLAPVITRLFLYDRKEWGSQYLGTMMKYMGTILTAHTPEYDVSWQMAMDENYVNSYRDIVLPNTADVKIYVFRDGFEGALSKDAAAAASAQGALVAELHNGAFVPQELDGKQYDALDNRFQIIAGNGSTITLRYPGTVDVRFDITGSADGLQVMDQQPVDDGANIGTTLTRGERGNIDSKDVSFDGRLQQSNGTSANALNARTDLAIAEGETLCVMAWNGSNSLDLPQKSENTYDAVKTFSVTFDANEGDGTMAPMQKFVSGDALTPNEFIRDGYAFTGWNTAADGSGTAYADGAAADLTSSTTLYAQWKLQTYSVDLYFRAPGIADKLGGQVKDFAANKSMKLTATPTYTTGGKTYYFDHWEFGVDEQTTLQYPWRIVTIRPSQGGEFKAYAVYSETQKTDFVPFVMIVREQRVGSRLVKTLTYSLPDGYELKVGTVGFKVYDEDDKEIGRAFSTNLTGETGTYTVTVVNPDDDVRVVGQVTYIKDGSAQTITAETKGVISE